MSRISIELLVLTKKHKRDIIVGVVGAHLRDYPEDKRRKEADMATNYTTSVAANLVRRQPGNYQCELSRRAKERECEYYERKALREARRAERREPSTAEAVVLSLTVTGVIPSLACAGLMTICGM